MNQYYIFGWLLLLTTSQLVCAQGNYVANSSNTTTPGTFNTLVGPGAGALYRPAQRLVAMLLSFSLVRLQPG